jgi:hypothetical protein
MGVHNREYSYRVQVLDKEHPIGKSSHETTPHATAHNRIELWLPLYTGDDHIERAQELLAETEALCFVPLKRGGRFLLGARIDDQARERGALIAQRAHAACLPRSSEGTAQNLGAHLVPWASAFGMRVVIGEATIKFGRQLGTDGERRIRRIRGDRVPEILHELEALCDAEATNLFEIERGGTHSGEFGRAGILPQDWPGAG